MLPQEPLQAVLPPTTLSKSYLPINHASSATATVLAEAAHTLHTSLSDAPRISRYGNNNNNGLGSTAKGIMIGVFSVLGAAGFCFLVFAIVYYFRYTQRGRIFLDRITRPGEYDDEQQFAKEEAEALEEMDDLQRAEYLRAKGKYRSPCLQHAAFVDMHQPLYKSTRPSPYKPTSPCPSSLRFKKRACQHGSSNQSLRLPTASSKVEPRSSSSIPSVVSRAICRCQSRTKSITGRRRSTKSRRTQALQLVSQPSHILCSDCRVRILVYIMNGQHTD